jgi:hypothetical protein
MTGIAQMNYQARYPLTEQLKEVQREIGMREHVYPQWIARGKITKADADRRLDTMRAVEETLAGLVAQQSPELPI